MRLLKAPAADGAAGRCGAIPLGPCCIILGSLMSPTVTSGLKDLGIPPMAPNGPPKYIV